LNCENGIARSTSDDPHLADDDRKASTRVVVVLGTVRIMGLQLKKSKNVTSNERVLSK
jgi:hypothetical protein